jgi:hypothetical protein
MTPSNLSEHAAVTEAATTIQERYVPAFQAGKAREDIRRIIADAVAKVCGEQERMWAGYVDRIIANHLPNPNEVSK